MIIGLSGRKQSGKSTAANLIYSLYMSQCGISNKIYLTDLGEIAVEDLYGDTNYNGIFDINNAETSDIVIKRVFSELDPIVKVYSFADSLKKDICINLLGLSYDQCYGTDDQKNTLTKLKWENMPGVVITHLSKCLFGKYDEALTEEDFDGFGLIVHDPGLMTGREVMEYVGTGIFRRIYENVWTESTLNKIQKDNPSLAIICDCRFPNEIEQIKNVGGKIIRLTRDPFRSTAISESALDKDKYDWSNFDYVIDNQELSLFDQSTKIKFTLEEILQLS